MLRKNLKRAAIVAVWGLFLSVIVSGCAEAMQTVKTVVIARHSIRAPLSGKELNELTPHAWPKNSVPAELFVERWEYFKN